MGNKDLGAARSSYKGTTHATNNLKITNAKGDYCWARMFRAVEAGSFRVRVRGNEDVAGLDKAAGITKGKSQIIILELMAAGEKIEIYHDMVIAADDTTDYGQGTVGTTVTKKFESYI